MSRPLTPPLTTHRHVDGPVHPTGGSAVSAGRGRDPEPRPANGAVPCGDRHVQEPMGGGRGWGWGGAAQAIMPSGE